MDRQKNTIKHSPIKSESTQHSQNKAQESSSIERTTKPNEQNSKEHQKI